jgi:hypothetical protein
VTPPPRTFVALAVAGVVVAMIAGVVWFLGPHHKLWVAGLVLVLLGLLGWLIFILPAYWD